MHWAIPFDILKQIIRYCPLQWLLVSKRINQEVYKTLDQNTRDKVLLFAVGKSLDLLGVKCLVRDQRLMATRSYFVVILYQTEAVIFYHA
jgi:hypothetical protein